MAINKKQFDSITKVCIALSYLDGDVDSAELAAFELVVRDLGMPKTDVAAAIQSALEFVHANGDGLDAIIAAECEKLPQSLHVGLFEAAAHMVLADGELTDAECLRLAALRSFLGIPEAAAYAVIASVAHAEPRLRCVVTSSLTRG